MSFLMPSCGCCGPCQNACDRIIKELVVDIRWPSESRTIVVPVNKSVRGSQCYIPVKIGKNPRVSRLNVPTGFVGLCDFGEDTLKKVKITFSFPSATAGNPAGVLELLGCPSLKCATLTKTVTGSNNEQQVWEWDDERYPGSSIQVKYKEKTFTLSLTNSGCFSISAIQSAMQTTLRNQGLGSPRYTELDDATVLLEMPTASDTDEDFPTLTVDNTRFTGTVDEETHTLSAQLEGLFFILRHFSNSSPVEMVGEAYYLTSEGTGASLLYSLETIGSLVQQLEATVTDCCDLHPKTSFTPYTRLGNPGRTITGPDGKPATVDACYQDGEYHCTFDPSHRIIMPEIVARTVWEETSISSICPTTCNCPISAETTDTEGSAKSQIEIKAVEVSWGDCTFTLDASIIEPVAATPIEDSKWPPSSSLKQMLSSFSGDVLVSCRDANNKTIKWTKSTSAGIVIEKTVTIHVKDVDEFDLTSMSDSDSLLNVNPGVNVWGQVSEDMADGDRVGITARAIDADGTNNSVTYTLTDDEDGRFEIDLTTGIVTIADASSIKAADGIYEITVKATSSDGSSFSKSFKIANLVSDLIDENAARNEVDEEQDDADIGIELFWNQPDVTYSLVDDAGGRFQVDGVTGKITTAEAINVDSTISIARADSYEIIAKASRPNGEFRQRTFLVVVNDIDDFNVISSGFINETITQGCDLKTVIGRVPVAPPYLTFDPDRTNNAVTYTLLNTQGGRFAVDSSGLIYTTAPIDLSPGSYDVSLKIESEDGSSATGSATATVIKNVTVVNGFPAEPISNYEVPDLEIQTLVGGVPDIVEIDEGSTTPSTVLFQAKAYSPTYPKLKFTYSLPVNPNALFTIDPANGNVRFSPASGFDFENKAFYNVRVRAQAEPNEVCSAQLKASRSFIEGRQVKGEYHGYDSTDSSHAIIGINRSPKWIDPADATISFTRTSGESVVCEVDGENQFREVIELRFKSMWLYMRVINAKYQFRVNVLADVDSRLYSLFKGEASKKVYASGGALISSETTAFEKDLTNDNILPSFFAPFTTVFSGDISYVAVLQSFAIDHDSRWKNFSSIANLFAAEFSAGNAAWVVPSNEPNALHPENSLANAEPDVPLDGGYTAVVALQKEFYGPGASEPFAAPSGFAWVHVPGVSWTLVELHNRYFNFNGRTTTIAAKVKFIEA